MRIKEILEKRVKFLNGTEIYYIKLEELDTIIEKNGVLTSKYRGYELIFDPDIDCWIERNKMEEEGKKPKRLIECCPRCGSTDIYGSGVDYSNGHMHCHCCGASWSPNGSRWI